KNYKLVVFFALSFIFVVSLLNAWNESAIFDETAHIGAAYSYVTQHEIRLNPEHPPLIKDLAGIPLLFLRLNFDVNQPFWDGTLPGKWDEGQWAAGRYLLYQAGNNPDLIIFWARFPIILLSLFFGFFIFKWGRELAGTMAGIVALILYSFDPNILGHSHFVTTDIGIAAFLAFAFYYYLKFIKYPHWKNVLLAGIFLGLLMLAKFSFLVALPVLGLATIIYPFVSRATTGRGSRFFLRAKKFGEYIGKGAIVFFISIIVVWVIYAANTFNMKKEVIFQAIENNFPATDTANPKNVYTNKTLHWLNKNSITRPLTEFGIGIGYVFRRVSGGNGAYFLGQVSNTAFVDYFPVVFMIKEPLPTLFFMFFALIIGLIKICRAFKNSFDNFFQKNFQNISRYLSVHIVEFCLALFILLYSYVSITGNLNIGFRHLFPILPFAYILTAKIMANFLKNKTRSQQTVASQKYTLPEEQRVEIFSFVFSWLFIFLILGTIFAYPYYMSYFNETAGGPKNGYRYVTDSNADWGQDLKRLGIFLDNHPEIEKIRVDYFGGGDINYYIGNKHILWWDSKRPVEVGWYAISTNFLQGSIYDQTKPNNQSYHWLKEKIPDYQVGTSILIYYLDQTEVDKANNL
ncbi:glycosyltransferase family 39 protein, partial [Patescibacteria group bacterium]|nr:glycosyltransferase family 39 protein [Patescibacteria group bacterium]